MTQVSEIEAAERARRRKVLYLALLLLLGLPVYLIVASFFAAAINPVVPGVEGEPPQRLLHWSVEIIVYLVLGVLWALPLKRLVQGVGKSAQAAPEGER